MISLRIARLPGFPLSSRSRLAIFFIKVPASTEGLAHKLPPFAGRSMQAELEALGKALVAPQRPVAAIVGGAKVSTKLELLGNLIEKVDVLIIGGGMANTFLAAQGKPVGKSLAEHDLAGTAREVLGIDPSLKMLFGISFGYREPGNPVNTFALDKAPLSETVTFHR